MTDRETPPNRSFSEFFAAEIAPQIEHLEAQRRDRLRATYARLGGTAFTIAIAAIIAWQTWHPVAGIALLSAGILLGFIWGVQPARRHRDAVRELFIPPLCRYLGDVEYHRKPGERFDLTRIERSGITGKFNRAKLEDLFTGRYRDTDFRMVEARLKQKRSSANGNGHARQRIVFSGLLCDVGVPVPFEGIVLLVGDKGALGNRIVDWLREKFIGIAPVTLDHAAFEERYQVYSDNAAEAVRLLQPSLLDTLLALADELGLQAVNCAFIEGHFAIALPQNENLFEVGRLHRSPGTCRGRSAPSGA